MNIKHTTHYRITINHIDKIITLDRPLSEAPFFQAPRVYCTKEDTKYHSLIHYGDCREEHYFRNYQDTLNYFIVLQKSKFYTGYLFNNIYSNL